MSQTAQTVATQQETVTGEVVDPNAYPGLRAAIQQWAIEAELPETSSQAFVWGIMENIFAAESVDDIFAAQKSPMISGKDFHGRPFYLSDENITIRKSTQAGGLPFYAIFTVTELATGEEFNVNCGGSTFMAILHKLRSIDYFKVTDEFPFGLPVVLISTPSPAGAYLQLAPVKVPTAASNGAKNGKK